MVVQYQKINRQERPHFKIFLEEWEKGLVDELEDASEPDSSTDEKKTTLFLPAPVNPYMQGGHLGAVEK